MTHPNINYEAWHATWLKNMSDFCWAHLSKKNAKHSPSFLVTMKDDESGYHKIGDIDLPPGSGDLIISMAKFSRCSFDWDDDMEGTFMYNFPKATFDLAPLLSAAFPKDLSLGRFKANDASAPWREVEKPEDADFIAFGGLGVILMNACRQKLSPLASDAEIVRMSYDHFLCILG